MRRIFAVAVLSFVTGCSQEGVTASAMSGASAPAVSASGAWSRTAMPSAAAPAASGGGSGTPEAVDPSALQELLAASPKNSLPSTGQDGGTAIGTETGVKEQADKKKHEDSAGVSAPAASASAGPAASSKVQFGSLSIQQEMSSASIEREARAQLYWNLVQRCRDKDKKLLPPDAVLILFRIDVDGFIVPSSITASPSLPDYEEAAHCMRRELSSATFRAPAGGRGLVMNISMTVPSVD